MQMDPEYHQNLIYLGILERIDGLKIRDLDAVERGVFNRAVRAGMANRVYRGWREKLKRVARVAVVRQYGDGDRTS